jgi:hypothetical protein
MTVMMMMSCCCGAVVMTVAAIVISLSGASEAILVERCSCWVVDAITTISNHCLLRYGGYNPLLVNLPK